VGIQVGRVAMFGEAVPHARSISAMARDQPTAVQVPSGLRQALPRATSGRPSM